MRRCPGICIRVIAEIERRRFPAGIVLLWSEYCDINGRRPIECIPGRCLKSSYILDIVKFMQHLNRMKHAHSASMILILMAVCILPQGMGWVICPHQGTFSVQSCGVCSLAPAAGVEEGGDQESCCDASVSTAVTVAPPDILTTTCCRRLSEVTGYIAQQTDPCRIAAPTAAAIDTSFHVEDQPLFQATVGAYHSALTRQSLSRYLFQDNCALLI